jgi:hypothetical protein
MSIKSLLLGSAAALAAVTGARAADAIVAPEPEPVEYVRVCDTYGTGYYYIPGTEICLRVGGYFRYDIGGGDLLGDDIDADGDADRWHKRSRFMLRIDAREETELGTLEGRADIKFNYQTNATDLPANLSVGADRIWVKLGGLLIGMDDSFFDRYLGGAGYASGVVNDGLIPYGPFSTAQISYEYDFGNGFSVGAAVEEGDGAQSAYDEGIGVIQDYAPHALIAAKYSGGVFSIAAVGAYDSSQDEFSVKGRIDVTPNDMFSLFVMGAWTDDDDGNGGNFYATWGGDWAIWAGGAVKFNDMAKLNVEFGYNDFSDYSIDADVNFTVVPGFVVTPGVGFRHGDGDPLSAIPDGDNWGGYLRTQFTF